MLQKTIRTFFNKLVSNDPLSKNALFLIAGSITGMVSGFIFWIAIARLYDTNDVGVASALISSTAMITGLSSFGFDFALIKYLALEDNKSKLINTCISISIISASILSLLFIVGIKIWSPNLIFLHGNLMIGFIFIFITSINSAINIIITGVFVGSRSSNYSFYINNITFLRIFVCPFLVAMGALGIYLSCYISAIISILFGFYLLTRIHINYIPSFVLDKPSAQKIFHYSLYNYAAKMLESLPIFVFSILIINLLGADMNAYFYIAYSISAIFIIIPSSVSNSFITECSYFPEKFKDNFKKSVLITLKPLALLIIIIILFGRYILTLFGEQYSEYSYMTLVLLAFASIPVSINYFIISIKRIRNEMTSVIMIFGLIALISILTSYVLMIDFGINGVGVAWFIGNSLVAFLLLLNVYINDKESKLFLKKFFLKILNLGFDYRNQFK